MSIRPVSRWLPHVPWLAAIAVLIAGLIGWSASAPQGSLLSVAPPPWPPVFTMDEGTFRQAVNPEELFETGLVEPNRSGE
jgi:hypothetical protein